MLPGFLLVSSNFVCVLLPVVSIRLLDKGLQEGRWQVSDHCTSGDTVAGGQLQRPCAKVEIQDLALAGCSRYALSSLPATTSDDSGRDFALKRAAAILTCQS